MLFNTANITIFICLLLINLSVILLSNRKRRYGLFPAKLFLFLFVLLWIGKVVVYFYVDKKVQDVRFSEIQVLSNFKNYNSGANNYGYVGKGLKTSSIRSIFYLRYIIRITMIQSIIATLLSLYGLIAVFKRNEFYLKMLALHSLGMLFCLGMELNIV
ncbi:MAG: hypothetical protein IPP32_15250 [Bacteroidetes bacterium]|nr:hypothetical protein [Bacteroidota bacterium]